MLSTHLKDEESIFDMNLFFGRGFFINTIIIIDTGRNI